MSGQHRLSWKAYDSGEVTQLTAQISWWNAFTLASLPNKPSDDYRKRLDDVMERVNEFVDQVQSWREAVEMVPA